MKKISLAVGIFIGIIACTNKEENFSLSGNVEGLKKGTLYLQRIEDTIVTNLDSVVVDGDAHFQLETSLKEPELLFLYLDKVNGDRNDDIVDFFAEEGKMNISTTLKKFKYDAVIEGSANQKKLEEYKKAIRRFNNYHLDLVKENFEAQKTNNEAVMLDTDKKYDNLLRRKYLYTVNFAINNDTLAIAPYLALSEVFDANIKYLDTIYNSLEKNIQRSKYGKQLKSFIKERKKLQKKEEKIQRQNK